MRNFIDLNAITIFSGVNSEFSINLYALIYCEYLQEVELNTKENRFEIFCLDLLNLQI